MKTVLHLLAMPLAYPLHPSSQLGYLHGFVAGAFAGRVAVRSYHAFLPILHALEGADMADFFERYSLVGEEVLYLACCHHAAKYGDGEFLPAQDLDDALHRYNSYGGSADNESQQNLVPISREKVVALAEAMEAYLDAHFVPLLVDDAINVIGMTASFCQVFGSVFAARHLQMRSSARTLFLFGGSSYSLPEGSRTLERWGIDGLLVAGSGEAPLARILEACLALGGTDAVAADIAAAGIGNVTRIGAQPRPIDLEMGRGYMSSLPDPNYDDYFADLRALCANDAAFDYARANLVSIPIEGSRGCFAKCDFCHNPNITSQFRSLSGTEVAERAIALVDRYGVPDVTFVDSVSNTWAEGYAEYLLARGLRVQAFMEMRVHAPESFWVKMALSGATTIQLGVESIAEPLLRSMRKGTTVMQNLSASKYMAEMGTRNASNLIIHHPKSTVWDVGETQRVMQLLEHFPIFVLSCFVVSYASPLYNELVDTRKAALRRGFDWLPAEFEAYTWPRHLSYTYPRAWVDAEVVDAWLAFQAWYADHVRVVAGRKIPPMFTVRRDGEALHFIDTRFGEEHGFSLTGAAARVHDACHRASTAAQVEQATGLARAQVEAALAELTGRKILIQIAEQYLSIAFRPQTELIDNYLKKPPPRRASAGLALAQVDRVRRVAG